jgi:hypothetical protein
MRPSRLPLGERTSPASAERGGRSPQRVCNAATQRSCQTPGPTSPCGLLVPPTPCSHARRSPGSLTSESINSRRSATDSPQPEMRRTANKATSGPTPLRRRQVPFAQRRNEPVNAAALGWALPGIIPSHRPRRTLLDSPLTPALPTSLLLSTRTHPEKTCPLCELTGYVTSGL